MHIQIITADKYIKQRLGKMPGKLDKNTNQVQDSNSIPRNYRFSKQSMSKGRGLCNITNKLELTDTQNLELIKKSN